MKGCGQHMKKIGVVICSYNGCEDTIKCIESLQRQTLQDFDIYVVDNASTDGTGDKIRQSFGEDVHILSMTENLGGAGGFGAGIAHAAGLGYEYIALMDNDIIVDEKAMELMMASLEADESLGAVGAKILWMHKPDVIFDFSNVIDVEHQKCHSPYREVYDNERLQGLRETDFVPATAGIFRTKAILEAGSMPVDNFIYYDDIELGWNMLRKGWRMVCCGAAKVWHKSSNANRKHDNFAEYYFRRNTLNFTAKYISEDKVEEFVDQEIDKVFPVLYGCAFKEMWRKFETTFYVFDDFARHVRGKAKERRIQPFSVGKNQGNKVLEDLYKAGYSKVRLIIEQNACKGRMLLTFLRNLWLGGRNVYFSVLSYTVLEGFEDLPLQQEVICCRPDLSDFRPAEELFVPDVTIHYCGHIKDMQENVLPDISIDAHYNVVNDERSWEYYQDYEAAYVMFRDMYRPLMLSTIRELRETV